MDTELEQVEDLLSAVVTVKEMIWLPGAENDVVASTPFAGRPTLQR
jgi:hypothetical protein